MSQIDASARRGERPRPLALIAAVADNGVIGADKRLPWHLPADLKRFRMLTWGKPIVMGRRTFESIGRALPGRTNIVLTRAAAWDHEGVRVAASLDEALWLAQGVAAAETMIIGGARIYKAALPFAERIYLTQIHADIEGDTYFPAIRMREWTESAREDIPKSVGSDFAYSFVTLTRRALA